MSKVFTSYLRVLRIVRELTTLHHRERITYIVCNGNLRVVRKRLISGRSFIERFKDDIKKIIESEGRKIGDKDLEELIENYELYYTPPQVAYFILFFFSMFIGGLGLIYEHPLLSLFAFFMVSLTIFSAPYLLIRRYYYFNFKISKMLSEGRIPIVKLQKRWWRGIIPLEIYYVYSLQGYTVNINTNGNPDYLIRESTVEKLVRVLNPLIVVADRLAREVEILEIEREQLRKAESELRRILSLKTRDIEKYRRMMYKETSHTPVTPIIILIMLVLILLILILKIL